MHPYISGCAQDAGSSVGELIVNKSVVFESIACKPALQPASQPATDVGMHGLLASQSCYPSVLPPCLSTLLASSRFLHC